MNTPVSRSSTPPRVTRDGKLGPVDFAQSPRYSSIATFAMLPRIEEVERADVAVLGAPFDSGVSFRPGSRFGPAHVREAARLLRPYNPAARSYPFADAQVVDAGDVAMNPFDIEEALGAMTEVVDGLQDAGTRVLAIGGDHTVSLAMLRSAARSHGPVALLHFDAHLDTFESIFGASVNHGTPFRRAFEEGLIDTAAIAHIGIRGPLTEAEDLTADAALGFRVVTTDEVAAEGPEAVMARLLAHIGDRPLYVSLDIDVLDPAFAPGTGTPEAGGLSSRELLAMLRALADANLVGADIVEVAPAYDHAAITGVAAAHAGYEIITAMAQRHRADTAAAEKREQNA